MVAINHIINKKGKKIFRSERRMPPAAGSVADRLLDFLGVGGGGGSQLQRAVLSNVSPGDICSK